MNVAFLDPCVAAAKINALRPPPEPMSMCALYQGAMAKDKRLPIAFGHDAGHGRARGGRRGAVRAGVANFYGVGLPARWKLRVYRF